MPFKMVIKMDKQLEESWFMIDEKLIYFYIKRKNIKNMYMRFTDEGKLLITTSKKCTLENIERFIRAKKNGFLNK